MSRVLCGVAALALMAVSFVTSTLPAAAYTLTGCRFSSKTIPYLVSGLPSGYDLTSARADWTNTTDISGWTLSSSVGRADFRFSAYGALGWSGSTSANTCPINSTYHNVTVSIRTNQTYTDGYSANKRISVMSHEIGHALGLNHNNTGSPCSAVVLMNGYDDVRYDNCGVYKTKTDDRNGVNYLY